MSRLKSGALVLLLLIPFGLYIAWQVQSAARADLSAPEPPSEKGVPGKEQIAASRGKAEKWVGDVRRTSAVALQYRAAEAADDPACAAVAKSAAARSSHLNNLEKFISGDKDAKFEGSLAPLFAAWVKEREALARSETAIDTWLRSQLSPPVDSPGRAAEALKGFSLLIDDYRKDVKFANLAKVAEWQVEARVKVIEALDEAASKPYDEVLNLPLAGFKGNKLVEKAVGLPAAIRGQVKLLQGDLQRAEEAKRLVSDRVKKSADAAIRSAREWETREQLLGLFADPELFSDPNKAADWLPKVHEQYLRAQQDPKARKLIQRKVKEFCDAFIPRAARLDDQVVVEGDTIPRAAVQVEFTSVKGALFLTDHPEDLNEFNFEKFHAGFTRIRWKTTANNSSGRPEILRPTPASRLAFDFTATRKDVTTWSVEAVNQLKKKCEGEEQALQQMRRTLTDRLVGAEPVKDPTGKGPPSNWTKENTKLWTRLEALSKAIEQHPALFEKNP